MLSFQNVTAQMSCRSDISQPEFSNRFKAVKIAGQVKKSDIFYRWKKQS